MAPEAEAYLPAVQDAPRLGLAVLLVEVGGCEFPRWVAVHREPLAGVQQLNQQHGIRAVAGDVTGAEPVHRIRRHGVAERPAVRQH